MGHIGVRHAPGATLLTGNIPSGDSTPSRGFTSRNRSWNLIASGRSLAHDVTRRTHELGIHMALAATSTDILRGVLGRGLALTAIVCASGRAPACCSTASCKAVTTAVLASYIPARRATRISPVTALNCE